MYNRREYYVQYNIEIVTLHIPIIHNIHLLFIKQCSVLFNVYIAFKVWSGTVVDFIFSHIYYANFCVRNRNILNMSKSIVKLLLYETQIGLLYTHTEKRCVGLHLPFLHCKKDVLVSIFPSCTVKR